MIEIYCNKKGHVYKEYIFNILFNTILGSEYSIKYTDIEGYRIESQRTTVLIPDILLQSKKQNWYTDTVTIYDTTLAPEGNIPVMYGEASIQCVRDKDFAEVRVGFDVFGCAFSIITRLEEFLSDKKDSIGRFPEEESLLIKNNLIERCIVNEYAELLWKCLKKSGERVVRAQRMFSFIATHDIDQAIRWNSLGEIVKTCIADIVKRKNIHLAIANIQKGTAIIRHKKEDDFNTFSYLMDTAERHNLHSIFYFLCNKRNNTFLQSKKGCELLNEIANRGHVIGLHPNFGTYNNCEALKKEKKMLESYSKTSVTDSRQHYLQIDSSKTAEILEKAGIVTDSSLYFSSYPGFRSGICMPYALFSLEFDKTLSVIEVPLTFMDTSILLKKMSKNYALQKITELFGTVQRYAGCFVLLWHNSSFHLPEWNHFAKELFEYTFQLYEKTQNGEIVKLANKKTSGCCS